MVARDLAPEKEAVYRNSALRRLAQERDERRHLQKQAWASAYRAAELLRCQFHATRLTVFGSLIRPDCFNRWSDVDLAAWGIAPEDTLRAIGAVMDLDLPVEVNLVVVETCKPGLLRVIEEEGVEL